MLPNICCIERTLITMLIAMTSCLIWYPHYLKWYQSYVMFCGNVDRRMGHRCSQYKWSNPKSCDPLFAIVLKIPYVYLKMCFCESPEIQKCELCYTGMCWTSADSPTYTWSDLRSECCIQVQRSGPLLQWYGCGEAQWGREVTADHWG